MVLLARAACELCSVLGTFVLTIVVRKGNVTPFGRLLWPAANTTRTMVAVMLCDGSRVHLWEEDAGDDT
jgi:hypothetical protein